MATIAPASDPSVDAGEEETTIREHVAVLDKSEPISIKVDGREAMLADQTWADLSLPAALIDGVMSVGWTRPAKPQAIALPVVMRADRPNLLLQAKNGSGKTGAFGLAMLACVDVTLPKVQALCMSPVRELALQTTERLRELAKFIPGMKIATVIGGVEYKERIDAHVVIATPGKAAGLCKMRTPLLDLSALRMFVIDEADDVIVHHDGEVMSVKKAATYKRDPPQVLLFSASFECLESTSPSFTRAKEFTDQILDVSRRTPVIVRITHRAELRNDNISHLVAELAVPVPGPESQFAAKLQYLMDMYNVMTVGQTLIFVNTRDGARTVAERMRSAGHTVSVITGSGDKKAATGARAGMSMSDRTTVRQEFEKGISKVLVCTDILARGFDVRGVKLVINFELPYTRDNAAEKYPDFAMFQHRCARVGRFGDIGAVIHLVASEQDSKALQGFISHFALRGHVLPDDAVAAGVMVEDAMRTPLPSA